MTLETAQILCTAIQLNGGTAHYKSTHQKHPVVIWAAASQGNFNWLKQHGLALAAEYTFRYGKQHACEEIIRNCSDETIPAGELQQFAQCMPEQYKDENPVAAYKNYYRGSKREIARWTKRATPYWF